MLDGDDWLYNEYCLEYIAYFIKINNVDITYGLNCEYRNNKVVDSLHKNVKDYNYETILKCEYRNTNWYACHLRVMKACYLKNINIYDLLDENYSFIECMTDFAESYCCLEQSKGKHKKLDEIVMVYNIDNSIRYSTSCFRKDDVIYREKIRSKIKSIQKYTNFYKKNDIIILDIESSNYKETLESIKKEKTYNRSHILLVKKSLLYMYNNFIKNYKLILNNSIQQKIIVRILSNNHQIKYIYENLLFTIENENSFYNTDKIFVLNKLEDCEYKKKIIDLLENSKINYIDLQIVTLSSSLFNQININGYQISQINTISSYIVTNNNNLNYVGVRKNP
jgi:hypothetical protein